MITFSRLLSEQSWMLMAFFIPLGVFTLFVYLGLKKYPKEEEPRDDSYAWTFIGLRYMWETPYHLGVVLIIGLFFTFATLARLAGG